MDACIFQSGFPFLTPLPLFLLLLLMLFLPRQWPRYHRLPARKADGKEGGEEACVGGFPRSDWLRRLAWISVTASEGKVAGF